MIGRRIATGLLATSLAFTAGTAAQANDALVGGIIGGIIGGAIINETSKNRTTRRTVVASPTREANREVQVALNHFGFDAGVPDGAFGPRTRTAISQYQMVLGYVPTGQLTDYERSHLVGSYHRAIAGGSVTMQQAAQNPMGMKGLLVAWRDEAMGVTPPAAATVTAPEAAAAAPALPALVPAAPALPNFLGGDTTQASLASHCNKVSLLTSTNGGFVTAATMTDPAQALSEQFCLARTYAIAQGEEAAARLPGVTPAQIQQQCAGFGPAMAEHVAALSLKPAAQVLPGVQSFALASGMQPAQLAATAKICLSVGYRTDDMGVAIGSALLLATLGEPVYGELMGHHLAQGFGTAARTDLALDWYDMGLAASGTTPVFAPGQPERGDLIRKAAYTIGGRVDLLPQEAPVPATLPSFALTTEPAPETTEAAAVVADPAPARASKPSTVAKATMATQVPEAPAAGTAVVEATAAVVPAVEPEATVVEAAAPVPAGPGAVNALPLAARLPFLLFRN